MRISRCFSATFHFSPGLGKGLLLLGNDLCPAFPPGAWFDQILANGKRMGRTERDQGNCQDGPEVALPVTLAIVGRDQREGDDAQDEVSRCPQPKCSVSKAHGGIGEREAGPTRG